MPPPADAARLARRRPQQQQGHQPPGATANAIAHSGGANGDAPSSSCRGRRRRSLTALLLLATATATPFLCSKLVAFNSKVDPADVFLPSSPRVDAAVVLGYALRRDGTPTGALMRRVRAGVAVWGSRASRGRLVFSGAAPSAGSLANDKGQRPTEAAVMARAALLELDGGAAGMAAAAAARPAAWRRKLIRFLLPPPFPDLLLPPSLADLARHEAKETVEQAEQALEARILRGKGWRLERRATSTAENARHTLAIAKEEGWASLAVVTSPWHARRALATFRRAAEGTGVRRIVVVAVPEEAARGREGEGQEEGASSGSGGNWGERLREAFDASVREAAAAALYRARGWT